MSTRREIMNYIGSGAIGVMIGYYVGAQELLGLQTEEVVQSTTEDPSSEDASSEDASSENASSEDTSSDDSSSDDTSTGDTSQSSADAFYTFEGSGTELVDRSSSNHTGDLNTAERVSGVEGQGIMFDQSQSTYSTLGSPGDLTPESGSFTISLYYQTTNTDGGGNQNKQRILAIRGSSNERVVITLKGRDGPRTTASTSEGGYDPDEVGADSSMMHADGEWHHVVLQRDMEERQLRLYVDGERVDTTEVTQIEISPDAPVYLGAQPEYPNPRHYTGKIDEVGIYDRVVAPDEISS